MANNETQVVTKFNDKVNKRMRKTRIFTWIELVLWGSLVGFSLAETQWFLALVSFVVILKVLNIHMLQKLNIYQEILVEDAMDIVHSIQELAEPKKGKK